MKNLAKKGAKRATRLLDAYERFGGERNVSFVLADLRHYCDEYCLNFHAALGEAPMFYHSEKRP